jgi:hypothetical protein
MVCMMKAALSLTPAIKANTRMHSHVVCRDRFRVRVIVVSAQRRECFEKQMHALNDAIASVLNLVNKLLDLIQVLCRTWDSYLFTPNPPSLWYVWRLYGAVRTKHN